MCGVDSPALGVAYSPPTGKYCGSLASISFILRWLRQNRNPEPAIATTPKIAPRTIPASAPGESPLLPELDVELAGGGIAVFDAPASLVGRVNDVKEVDLAGTEGFVNEITDVTVRS